MTSATTHSDLPKQTWAIINGTSAEFTKLPSKICVTNNTGFNYLEVTLEKESENGIICKISRQIVKGVHLPKDLASNSSFLKKATLLKKEFPFESHIEQIYLVCQETRGQEKKDNVMYVKLTKEDLVMKRKLCTLS